MNILLKHIYKDPVLSAAFVLALVSCFFVLPSGDYIAYLDLHVLSLLLSLMLVVAGLQKAGLFDVVTRKLLGLVHSVRILAIVLICLCFFCSMLITNDVALITFVPLAILILEQTGQQKYMIPVIVLQTIAANLGSMFTPLGNPQNLYLYALSGLSLGEFMGIMGIPTVISFLLLLLFALRFPAEEIEPQKQDVKMQGVLGWCILFVVCLLCVLHIIHYGVMLAVVLGYVIIKDRTLLKKADYGLLLTFIFFFVFIGNIKNIPEINVFLNQLITGRDMPMGILLSQVISNVPAAMLLSGFSQDFSALLLGVNLGGLGILIASMASLISYKFYEAVDGAKMGKYMLTFTVYNVIFLAILWICTALFYVV